MKALRQIIETVRSHRDEPWALATLVETRGSTYRKPGARMLIDAKGGTIGVLSGGCLEEEIARRGRAIINGAPALVLNFDTRRLYGCDGNVRILIERVEPAGESGNFITALGSALDQRQVRRLRSWYENGLLGTDLLEPTELVVEHPGMLVHCVPLPLRLFLFGTGPEIGPIQEISRSLGWIVHSLANASELPDDVRADDQTAAVVMTHNFGRDLAALDRLLSLQLPYLGILGPRKRHRQMFGELLNHRSIDPGSLQNIYAPAGLDLGSEAPEEIALSIVSEISAVLANRKGGCLREREVAIHLEEHVA
ncbi:MAG TPA: XdhC family protein [Chthoniobacteraceae bacterium]|nr:XdhC family protein [Chthoniobacteraceae bacterium]